MEGRTFITLFEATVAWPTAASTSVTDTELWLVRN
jgi:hypothetical protein